MSGILRWREEWTLNIDVLDEDHVALVEFFNRIVGLYGGPYAGSYRSGAGGNLARVAEAEATRAERSCPAGGADLVECLVRLGERAREHFHREEEFMRSIDYPDYAAHKSEHALLLAEYTELLRDYANRRPESLAVETLLSLRSWLISHMTGEDRRVADYYYGACGARPAAPTEHEVE
jgi:hemerythrin